MTNRTKMDQFCISLLPLNCVLGPNLSCPKANVSYLCSHRATWEMFAQVSIIGLSKMLLVKAKEYPLRWIPSSSRSADMTSFIPPHCPLPHCFHPSFLVDTIFPAPPAKHRLWYLRPCKCTQTTILEVAWMIKRRSGQEWWDDKIHRNFLLEF